MRAGRRRRKGFTGPTPGRLALVDDKGRADEDWLLTAVATPFGSKSGGSCWRLCSSFGYPVLHVDRAAVKIYQNRPLRLTMVDHRQDWSDYGSIRCRQLRLNSVTCWFLGALLIQACGAQEQCGSQANGALCDNNLCCSEYGFCGTTSTYCGTGCQSNCNSNVTTVPGLLCGVNATNELCASAGDCCSQFGFCGSTAEYCGAGCQNGPCEAGDDRGGGLKTWAKAVIAVGAVAAAVTVGTVIFCCVKRRRSRKERTLLPSSNFTTKGLSLGSESQPDGSFSQPGMSYIFNDNHKVLGMRFSYDYLNAATNGFSKELGRGSFGVVYKGVLKDDTEVAVKSVLNNRRGLKDFEAEIKTLGSINHANLVALRGFCFEPKGTPYIVYEFARNGSLDEWIFPNDKTRSLPWKVRVNIARGTAKGLAYLHEDLQVGQAIIHLDVKPENILLDENFTPKVADFGMAKLIGDKKALTIASGGTLGYMAPETYAEAASTKMDVYSFGMVLVELVCGRRHLDRSLLPKEEFYLPSWALRKLSVSEEHEIVDPSLNGNFDATEARRLITVALLCLRRDPEFRWDMGTVWRSLEGLTPLPEISEDLKSDFDMVERLLRRSNPISQNGWNSSSSLATSSTGSTFSTSVGGSFPLSLGSSSSERPGADDVEKPTQANINTVPETVVQVPSDIEHSSQLSSIPEMPQRDSAELQR
ncbi:hypothetical protein R1sor_019448 [Riccia sorocarpa]|uniref:Protein kinase domain-containing protein n=1 Tax=Riccia sorocarpa TaxID=122646 RepID=A0ABD3IGQ0_9MARC